MQRMCSCAALVCYAVIAQALATDSVGTSAEKLVDKLTNRMTSAPIDLTGLEQTTLAKTHPVNTYGKANAMNVMSRGVNPPRFGLPLASYQPQLRVNAMAPLGNYMQATKVASASPLAKSPVPAQIKPVLTTMDTAARAQGESVSAEGTVPKIDTGSVEAQVEFLTNRIIKLTPHFQANRRDFHGRRGFLAVIQRRKNLLRYLNNKDRQRYLSLVEKLGLKGKISKIPQKPVVPRR